MMSGTKTESLLRVRSLETHFYTYAGTVKALDRVNLDVYKGQMLGLVGESGCGKSVTSLSIVRLVPSPGKIVGGEVWFDGKDLLRLSDEEMRKIRGARISMVFQDPTLYLNPVLDIGYQIAEPLLQHRDVDKLEPNAENNAIVKQKVVDILKLVRFPDPDRVHRYPHELSGGMRQRVLIAMALVCDPDLIILDEPTTQLDVTVQAQILTILKEIRARINAAMIFVTHNLALARETCDVIAIMYAGTIVERAQLSSIFENPKHPYTIGLLKSVPRMSGEIKRLESIPGTLPNLISPPPGCRFHPRCAEAMAVCREIKPSEVEVEPGHFVACHLYR